MLFLGTPGQQALPSRVSGFRGLRPILRKQGSCRLPLRNARRSRLSASALVLTGAEHRPVATPKAPLRAFPRFCTFVLPLRLSLSHRLSGLFSIGPRSARRGRADSFTVRAEAVAVRGAFCFFSFAAGGVLLHPHFTADFRSFVTAAI